MKKFYYVILIALYMTSCSNYELKEIKYDDGTICSINKQKKGCDTVFFKEYYRNGVLRSQGTCVDSLLEGLYTEYYPDGKLKYNSYYVNGKLQLPKTENPYIDVSFGKMESRFNKRCIPFRISVDGVDPVMYKVYLEDTLTNLITPKTYGERIKTYDCTNENGDLLKIYMDESMYNYYIEDFDALVFHEGSLDNSFAIYVYYPDTSGNKRIEKIMVINISNPNCWVIREGVY